MTTSPEPISAADRETLDRLSGLAKKVPPFSALTVNSYDHGGARVFVDNTATNKGRDLVADFYGEGENRDYLLALYEAAPALLSAAARVVELEAEVRRLREDRDSFQRVGIASEARATALLEVLRPFANTYREVMKNWPDVFVMVSPADKGAPLVCSACTVGDFARATELAALPLPSAAPTASPAAGWQPIASAPKDGTFLLLFARCKTATAAIPVLGSFCDDEWQELAFTPNYPVGIVPTHWMPRPDWPAPSEEARAG